MHLDGHRGHGGVAGWRGGVFPGDAIIGEAGAETRDMQIISKTRKAGGPSIRLRFQYRSSSSSCYRTCMLSSSSNNPRILRRCRSRSICPSPNQSRIAAEKRSLYPKSTTSYKVVLVPGATLSGFGILACKSWPRCLHTGFGAFTIFYNTSILVLVQLCYILLTVAAWAACIWSFFG
jgi:hypothetical protein